MADQYYGLTDPGKQRDNNEDTFIAQMTVNGRFVIACVIDGVGGYSGGEVAAALAREAILKRLERPAGEVIPILLDCFNLANQKILAAKKANSQHESMACVATLALVDLERNQFHYVHVGDTRLYLLRDESLVKVTHDQSFVGFLEESGRLTEEAAMAHPKRNEINKALGFETAVLKDDDYIETGHSPFLPGDMLLLCSDGLTDMATKTEITDILIGKGSLAQKCENLITVANANGGKDNVTAVLVSNDKQATNHNATKPIASQKKTELDITIPPPTPVKATEVDAEIELKSKRAIWPWVVVIIIVLIAAGGVWQYFRQQQADVPLIANTDSSAVPKPKPIDSVETNLQTMIDSLKGNVLMLTDSLYSKPIKIDKAIRIDKDSLFVKTKGHITLIADSAYEGAAIELSSKAKMIFIDSMIIKGFKTGIINYNNALTLKRVSFSDCVVPVQNEVSVPNNKPVSGPATSLKVDTVPVKPKTSNATTGKR